MTQDEWAPVDGKDLEPGAMKAVRSKGHVLVTAGPGSGKTEMLAQKACFLLQADVCRYPKRILAVSFKRDAATELEKRVNERCGNLSRGRFTSRTFDAFAKSILDRFRLALPREIRPSADYSLGGPGDDEFIKELAKERDYIKWNGEVDIVEFEKAVVAAIEKEDTRVVGEALKLLMMGNGDQKSHLTYKMVFALTNRIIKRNSMISNAIRLTYSHVFLDEFQDITEPQYEMVKWLFLLTASVTAVGDDKQRIMVWADAMQDSFGIFREDFSPEQIQLYWNHRSAPRLVALQKQMYGILGQENSEATHHADWGEDDGEVTHHGDWDEDDGGVTLVKSKNDLDEAIWLAEEIKRLLDAHVPAKEISVLRRQKKKAYVERLMQELDKRNIRSLDESSDEIDAIISDDFLRFLLSFAWVALGGRDADCWQIVRSALQTLLGFYGSNEEYAGFYSHEIAVKEWKTILGEELLSAKGEKDIERAFARVCYDWLRIENIALMNASYTEDYLNKRLSALSKTLHARMERWGNIKESVGILLGKSVIRLMTIHKSKGMEFEHVYLVGLEDGAFFGMEKESMRDEERRAFFVALSRAKKGISFTYCMRREIPGRENQKCAYVKEFYDIIKQNSFVRIVDLIENPPAR